MAVDAFARELASSAAAEATSASSAPKWTSPSADCLVMTRCDYSGPGMLERKGYPPYFNLRFDLTDLTIDEVRSAQFLTFPCGDPTSLDSFQGSMAHILAVPSDSNGNLVMSKALTLSVQIIHKEYYTVQFDIVTSIDQINSYTWQLNGYVADYGTF